MLNFLESDLYRLVRQGSFWTFMLVLPALVTACIVAGLLLGAETDVLPSVVSLVPNMSDSGVVVLTLTLFFVLFLQADSKQDALKSLLATPHARRDYVLSKAAVLLIASLVYVLATQATMVAIGLLFGVSVASFDPFAVVAGTAGMTLACAAYAALGFVLASFGKAPSLVMVAAVLATMGTFDFGIMFVLDLVSAAYPALVPVSEAIEGVMLVNATAPLSSASSIALTPEFCFCVAVCLGYVAAAVAVSLLVMRRRTVS